MNVIDNGEIEVRGKRPTFLTVLCILSFVSMGYSVLTNGFGLASGPSSAEEMQFAKVELAKSIQELKAQGMDDFVPVIEKIARMGEQLNDNHYAISIMSLLVTLFGAYGVYLMFRGAKLGFHIYIIHCLLSVITIYLFVSVANIPMFFPLIGFGLSGLFIFLYSRNLKWMR
ncbi:MAG: hypothetical protein ACJA1C_003299 [Crocinitomicaceae bacterium]|jgi:hypothetical protein